MILRNQFGSFTVIFNYTMYKTDSPPNEIFHVGHFPNKRFLTLKILFISSLSNIPKSTQIYGEGFFLRPKIQYGRQMARLPHGKGIKISVG